MKKNKIKNTVIIHFLPLEFYPPVTNLLNYFHTLNSTVKVTVISTCNDKNRNNYKNSSINIIRSFSASLKENLLIRLFKYFWFNISTLLTLIKIKPETVLYYETYSAFPVYLYHRFINKKCKIYIHFHEYFSSEWYNSGMRLVKFYHKYEKSYLFKQSVWISQTNSKRIELFKNDNIKLRDYKLKIMPNYPSKSWAINRNQEQSNYSKDKLKIVFVGSVSLKSCYIKEFCDFVLENESKMTFDIYSYNLDRETRQYLEGIKSNAIRFISGGIEYDSMPNVLRNYEIGVILYKAYDLNFKYNAPNKLFEYLACGLDVWFPTEMHGVYEFEQEVDRPRVIKLDFNKLNKFNYTKYKFLVNERTKDSEFFYEYVYNTIAEEIF